MSIRSSVQNTLLTLVWLPVLCDRSVRMYVGRAIFMLWCPNIFSSSCIKSRFSRVKRCAFQASSHIGWWQLKSPSLMVCSGFTVCCCLSWSRMNADTCVSALLLSPSLYMLMICNVPNCPCISIAVMSGCSNLICFQASVRRLALTRIMDLVLSGCSWCVLGYMVSSCSWLKFYLWSQYMVPVLRICHSCFVLDFLAGCVGFPAIYWHFVDAFETVSGFLCVLGFQAYSRGVGSLCSGILAGSGSGPAPCSTRFWSPHGTFGCATLL